MADFSVSQFRGIRPDRSALKLPEGEAQTASNAKLGSGDLEPWIDYAEVALVANLYTNKTIYKFDNDDDPRWFEWDNYVDVARGSVKGDPLERTYYTGDGAPKMTYIGIAEAGLGPFPTNYRRLGIPAPGDPVVGTAPTVVGQPLPEAVDSSLRRVEVGSLKTKKFEIVHGNFTAVGSGTPTTLWNMTSAGQLAFDLAVGDSVKVTEIIDEDRVRLGSTTGTGVFASTAANDKSSTDFWQAMTNDGDATRLIEGVGWRIPDGVEARITGHLLRVGDTLRITRTDYSAGIIYEAGVTQNYYEIDWDAEVEVTIDEETFYQTSAAKVKANTSGTSDFPALKGSFYYDVDRAASDVNVLEDRTYLYTYVSNLGEEGPPSRVSGIVQAIDGDTITITGIEAPPTYNREITTIRIYRTSATAAGTEYRFVRDVSVEDVFRASVSGRTTDSVPNALLGKILDTETWDPPDPEMHSILALPNGMMIGVKGKNVYMCEPYFPHAWPAEYDQAINYEIVGTAAIGNSAVLLTEGTPYILTGSHPRNVNIRPFKINQACVSKQSIASTEDRVIYASPDGLVEISANGAKIVTRDYVGKEEWDAFEPTTIVGEIHDGKYFGFFDGPDNVTQPPAAVALTGTVVNVDDWPVETDIVAGGRTIILTLTSDTWIATGAAALGTELQTQALLNGLVSDGDYNTGWNAIRHNILTSDVSRDSATQVTITLSARAEYSILEEETITCTVPNDLLVTSTVDLIAPETFTINQLEDYTSIVVAFADFDNGGTDLAYAISSHLDILDWDSYSGIGQTADHEITPTDAIYAPSLDRWIVTSNNGAGAVTNPSTPNIATSDDNGVTWTPRVHAYTLQTSKAINAITWHPAFSALVAGGDNLSLQYSPDGETWSVIPVDEAIDATADIVGIALAPEAARYMFAAVTGVNFLLRSQDLHTNPVSNTWTGIAITYDAATGSKLIASGDGAIVSIGSGVTNMEIAYTAHLGTSGAKVGTINSYNCVGLVFAENQWVAISDDFRIVTCTGDGDASDIAKWSAPGTAEAAGVTMAGIKYCGGDSYVKGFKYIAYGVIDASGLGIIYTSDDAATWTLRHTQTETVGILALATKYPEAILGATQSGFSPTYNGATAPTLLGDSYATYAIDVPDDCGARAFTSVYVTLSETDAIIAMDGYEEAIRGIYGIGDTDPASMIDQGSYNEPTELALFNLNERPDEIRISITEYDYNNNAYYAEAMGLGYSYRFELITLKQFFTLDNGLARGITVSAHAVKDGSFGTAPVINTPGVKFAHAQVTAQFTFRKAGYDDLSVSYVIRARANAECTTP